MALKVPGKILKLISVKISSVFDSVIGTLLGSSINFNNSLSLPGIYEEATRNSGGLPDQETLNSLAISSKNYIDSLKLQTINKTHKLIEAKVKNGKINAVEVEKALRESWESVTSKLKLIVESEASAYRNIGMLEGIIRVNSSLGIKDPAVVFITSKDAEVCADCTRLHLMPDKITPRAWKLSEINHEYFKKGGHFPSISGLHPACRCTMITLLPGFGYKNGKLIYISEDYAILSSQRS